MALRACAAAVCAGAVLAAGCGGSGDGTRPAAAPPQHFAGVRVPPDSPATDFALRDQSGHLVRLSAERGRLVLLTFLYTHCVDVCPLIAGNLNRAVAGLGPESRSVRILAVSVDPVGDTPAAVRSYVAAHRLLPQFRWLLGTRAQLAPVWQAYNVLIQVGSAELVRHGAPILLLDRQGRPLLFYRSTVPAAAVLHDLRLLIR